MEMRAISLSRALPVPFVISLQMMDGGREETSTKRADDVGAGRRSERKDSALMVVDGGDFYL